MDIASRFISFWTLHFCLLFACTFYCTQAIPLTHLRFGSTNPMLIKDLADFMIQSVLKVCLQIDSDTANSTTR